jgi:hypothetical protein
MRALGLILLAGCAARVDAVGAPPGEIVDLRITAAGGLTVQGRSFGILTADASANRQLMDFLDAQVHRRSEHSPIRVSRRTLSITAPSDTPGILIRSLVAAAVREGAFVSFAFRHDDAGSGLFRRVVSAGSPEWSSTIVVSRNPSSEGAGWLVSAHEWPDRAEVGFPLDAAGRKRLEEVFSHAAERIASDRRWHPHACLLLRWDDAVPFGLMLEVLRCAGTAADPVAFGSYP